MKTIIAGCRHITDYALVEQAIEASGFSITEVVSGHAQGVDMLGEHWAELHWIPVKSFPADWKNLNVKPCVVRYNSGGAYNAAAGGIRNQKMSDYAQALLACWDGKSKGTKDMIQRAQAAGLTVFVFYI